jgi:NAD(P)H-dependent flavin oxidoreductase YrpB (nitropropane dioxygenase family)
MKTALCDRLGIEIPIIQAPMAGAVGPALAAAVSNSGALGALAPWRADDAALRKIIRETRALTSRPFVVNLNLEFPQERRLAICLEEGVRLISSFWRDPSPLMKQAKAGGAVVLHTVATAEDARRAVDCGVDVIVAQGWEAGGHVRGAVASMALIPAVVDAVGNIPVVAAGGIADGRGLAAALMLGAAGAWIGTRFLAAEEAPIHPIFRQGLFRAKGDDTVYCADLFNIGWPDAPHRVLRNSTVRNWEEAGRPPPGQRPGEGDVLATSGARGQVVRYQSFSSGVDTEGDVEAIPQWAGQGVALVNKPQPAAEIVREINDQAERVIVSFARSATAVSR